MSILEGKGSNYLIKGVQKVFYGVAIFFVESARHQTDVQEVDTS